MEQIWADVREGDVLESYAAKRRDRKLALKFLRKSMKRRGQLEIVVTDKLRSYGSGVKIIGNADRQEAGCWLNNRAENSHLPSRRRERANLRFDECKVRRISSPQRLCLQPFQPRTQPLLLAEFQAELCRRSCRVARLLRGIKSGVSGQVVTGS